MKTSTVLALGALGAAAWWLSRKDGDAASASAPGAGNVEFDPDHPEAMPDFEEVVGDVSEDGEDFFFDGFPPGPQQYVENLGQFQGDPAKYAFDLWRPASRIRLATLTQADIVRAGEFLGGNWRRGVTVGCRPTKFEIKIKEANERLLEIAEGLDIGSQIGIGLASVFGFGAGAAAADKSFGFGRGAEEQRLAMIDLASVPVAGGAGMSAELTYGNTYQLPREYVDPKDSERRGDGYFQRMPYPSIVHFGGIGYPILVNLFKPNLVPYDDHWSDDGLSKLDKIHREDGQDLVPVGMVYPWLSRQMGCYHRSKRKRMYVAARMLRVIDMIQAAAFPTEPAVDTQGLAYIVDAEGNSSPTYAARFVTFKYKSPVFGQLSGTIFPPLPGDKEALPIDSGARTQVGDISKLFDDPVPTQDHEVSQAGADLASETYVPPPTILANVGETLAASSYVAPVAGATATSTTTYSKSTRLGR